MYKKPAFWLITLGVATLLAGSTILFLIPAMKYSKERMSYSMLIGWQLIWWYCWLPIVPLILSFARRFPIDHGRWFRNLATHFPAAILFTWAHLSLYLLCTWYLGGKWVEVPKGINSPLIEIWTFIITPSQVNFRTRLLLYAALVLAVQAFDTHGRSEQEELRALDLEKKLAQAKLQALKMQLHPHFLFNTLHSISALLYKDIHGAEEMIERLMKFLAMTLENNAPQVVTLEKELEFLQCYLEIETVRFQDRLSIKMEIDSNALDAKVPNLITQPIVENAIRHGIATKAGAGRILIRATSGNGRLRIEVTDNGPGFTQVKEGLGLRNTRARLQHLYGNEHRLEFTNDSNSGLTVILEIPHQTEPQYRSILNEATA